MTTSIFFSNHYLWYLQDRKSYFVLQNTEPSFPVAMLRDFSTGAKVCTNSISFYHFAAEINCLKLANFLNYSGFFSINFFVA